MDEQSVEISMVVTRIVLQGADCERLLGILKYIRAGLELDAQQRHWAGAILDELKEESWR